VHTQVRDDYGKDFLRLPGGCWSVWRCCALRSAGFPARLVDKLADPVLARAADECLPQRTGRQRRDPRATARYEAEFDAAAGRAAAATAELAQDDRFREALAWQNRTFLATCVDRDAQRPRRDSGARHREAAIASYLQRYATKNDSIGFFGPIGWASWQPAGPAATVNPGPALLARRTVYFESWAIDAVGRAFAERPEILPGVPPRRVPANYVRDGVVHFPVGRPVRLTPQDAAILDLCDGVRTVHEIAADSLDRLLWMAEQDLVRLDLGGPIDAFPERLLRTRLHRIPDPAARRRAVQELDELTAARDTLAAAAGDADKVVAAVDQLNQGFERLAGASATRLHGQTYAGRTIVYEDTTRDVDVHFGPDLLAELGPPLSLVLDSGRWLAARIGADCLARFDDYFDRKQRRLGGGPVPLAGLLALATRDLYTESRVPPVSATAIAELQEKWRRVLAIPPHVSRHEVTVAGIAAAVAEEFATPQPAWTTGLVHSPDVMIAAASAESINQGRYHLVLGELHTAFNTIEARALVEQSPDKHRLLAMDEALGGGRRVVTVAPRDWGATTARTSPPSALVSPTHLYWAPGTDDTSHLPADPIPVAALEVERAGGELVVRRRDNGQLLPFAEVIGDYLSVATLSAFRLVGPQRHTPRISIDRLVVARETWRMPLRKCDWAFQLDERRRYLQTRAWVARHRIPRRAFYSVAVEMKPTFVDFSSIALVNVMASAVRRAARADPEGGISVSEMYPDLTDTWLVDVAGETYTSELRLVAVEPRR
jgi:hypothetical protein